MHLFSRLTGTFAAKAERSRNRPLFEAAMASAALAACAEGTVSFAKRLALDQVLDGLAPLKAFEVHGALDLFQDFVDRIQVHPEQGRAQALMALSAFAGQREPAELLVRIACALARAEGAPGPGARAEIAHLAAALGVPAPELGGDARAKARAGRGRPTVILLGNEKGGTGKSTTAMHLVVALLRRGHRVGSLDLDGRQGTLSRYVANREARAARTLEDIPLPRHRCLEESDLRDRDQARSADARRLEEALAELAECRFVVADAPGSHGHLSRLGHAQADVLITPLNDSFLDLDVLARIDHERRAVLEPSDYARMVWAQNDRRAARGRAPIDWIVMRNRLAHLEARNTREMADLLERLAERMHFRLHPGLSERVVFRELFYQGLTLLDLPEEEPDARPQASRQHARREVQELVDGLRLPGLAPPEAARAPQVPVLP